MLEQLLFEAVGDSTIGTLASASIGLISAPLAPTPTTPFSAITEATFDGYVRMSAPFSDVPIVEGQNGKILALGTTQIWIPTGSDTPNTIYGQFLANGSSSMPTLLAVEMFDVPIPMTSPLTFISDTPIFGLDPTANYGMSSVSS
jgi:hypothetical protein